LSCFFQEIAFKFRSITYGLWRREFTSGLYKPDVGLNYSLKFSHALKNATSFQVKESFLSLAFDIVKSMTIKARSVGANKPNLFIAGSFYYYYIPTCKVTVDTAFITRLTHIIIEAGNAGYGRGNTFQMLAATLAKVGCRRNFRATLITIFHYFAPLARKIHEKGCSDIQVAL